MKVLNYISYVLTSIFIPQPVIAYMTGKGLFNDSNTWPAVITAGLISGFIFLVFALIDTHLRRTKFERGLRINSVKEDEENDK